MTKFAALLRVLHEGRVEFIVVGGLAATVHGAARVTYDIDIVYERSRENLTRIAQALEPLKPYLRGAPPDLPFRLDGETLMRGLNFTLVTSLGDLDLLGELAGGGTYANLLQETIGVEIQGMLIRFLNLDCLIRVKRAAGRPKDFEALAELEALREEQERKP